jgi:hypothetical protein
MFVRVCILFLGLLGGTAAAVLGGKWISSTVENAAVIEQQRGSSDEAVQRTITRLDDLSRAAYFLLGSAILGIVGAFLGGAGRGKLAALLLLVAVPGPVIFSYFAATPTSCLLLAGLLALFVRNPRQPDEVGLRGCWIAVKNGLNIGGVKVRFENTNPNVSKSGSQLAGQVVLRTKLPHHVTRLHYKLLMKRSKGKGEDRKNKEWVLGETSQPLERELQAGESVALPFRLPYTFDKGLKDRGGMLGGIGKLAAFAMNEKDEVYLIAEVEMPGVLFEPSTKLRVQMID